MRFEENHEALEEAAPAKASAAPGEKVTPSPMNPLTRAALNTAIEKVRERLQVECAGIFKIWGGDARILVEDAVSSWLIEQFDAYLRQDEVGAELKNAFAEVLTREVEVALLNVHRDEAFRIMRDRGLR